MIEKLLLSVENSKNEIKTKILDEPNQKFSNQAKEIKSDASISPINPAEACSCGSFEFWRAHGSNDYRCKSCSPPPSRSLVAEWLIAPGGYQDPEPVAIFFGEPTCSQCRSMLGIQSVTNGIAAIKCWTCGAKIDDPWLGIDDNGKEHAIRHQSNDSKDEPVSH